MKTLLFFFLLNAAQAQTTLIGKSSHLNSLGVSLFTMENAFNPLDTTMKHVTTFRDENGVLLSEETVLLAEDGQIESYIWTQHQNNQRFTMTRQGDKWKLKLNDDKETLRVPSKSRVLVPPIIAAGLAQEWKKKEELKTFQFQLLAPDRMETFSFIFHRTSEDAEFVTWTLKPENFFVRMVAGEIIFVFKKDKTLHEIRDFTPPIKFLNAEGRLGSQKTSLSFH